MRRSNFALRVSPALLAEARKAAKDEGIALNQLISLALAEKVSAIRTQAYFEERAGRADSAKADLVWARIGKDNAPMEGDQLPPEFVSGKMNGKEMAKRRAKTR